MCKIILFSLLLLPFHLLKAQTFEAGATAGYSNEHLYADYRIGGTVRGYVNFSFLQAGVGLEQRSFSVNPEMFVNGKFGNRHYGYGGVVLGLVPNKYVSKGIQFGGVLFFTRWFGLNGEYTFRHNVAADARTFRQREFTYHMVSAGVRFAF